MENLKTEAQIVGKAKNFKEENENYIKVVTVNFKSSKSLNISAFLNID